MLFSSFAHRQRADEWMDAPDANPRQVQQSLRFIRRINSVLGYTRATLWHLERMTRDLPADARITLIDFATGSADIPLAILRWADRRGLDIHVVGVDRNPQIVGAARNFAHDPRLEIVQADVLSLPFADNSFDIALTAMFLHHLSDQDAARVLSEMSPRRAAGDHRRRSAALARAYAWITLLDSLGQSDGEKRRSNQRAASVLSRRSALAARARGHWICEVLPAFRAPIRSCWHQAGD